MKIFISYRKSDSKWVTFTLYNALRQQFPHAEVFKDFKAIKAGEDYTIAIEKSLRECTVLLVVIDSEWLYCKDADGVQRLFKEDDWVCLEIASALKSGKKVIPVLIDQTEMPKEDLLPYSIRDLPKRQAIRLHLSNFEMDVFTLANAINESIGQTNQYSDLVRDIASGKVSQKEIEKPETNAAYAVVCICLGLLILWLNSDSAPVVWICIAMTGFGIYAFMLSKKVKQLWLSKNFELARKNARNVKLIGWIAPVAGMVLIMVVLLLDTLKFMSNGGMDQVNTLMKTLQKDSASIADNSGVAPFIPEEKDITKEPGLSTQAYDNDGQPIQAGSGEFDYMVYRDTNVYTSPSEDNKEEYYVVKATPVRIVEINNPFVKVEFYHSDEQLYSYWLKAADLEVKH